MLVCGCGGWMHTEGVEERISREGDPTWFVRSECRPCQWVVGVDVPVGQVDGLVDRLMWTDDARHRLDRVPPMPFQSCVNWWKGLPGPDGSE